jgi:hypothetical protein
MAEHRSGTRIKCKNVKNMTLQQSQRRFTMFNYHSNKATNGRLLILIALGLNLYNWHFVGHSVITAWGIVAAILYLAIAYLADIMMLFGKNSTHYLSASIAAGIISYLSAFRVLFLSILLIPLGCFSGGGPPAPAPAPPSPQAQDVGVVAARDQERARRRAASSNTILTSPLGVTTAAPVALKTLFGQS